MIVHRHRIHYHETDRQGFLFNSRHLELTDVGMVEFIRGLGWQYERLVAEGTDPSVVDAHVSYRLPLRFDDLVDIDVEVVRVGTSSFSLRTRLLVDDAEHAVIELVYVNIDPAAGTSRPLREDVADRLRGAMAEVG